MKNNLRTPVLLIVLILFGSILFYSNILNYPIYCKNDNFILEIEPNKSASHVAITLDDNTCINTISYNLR